MTTTSSKPKSWRDVLPIHPAAELFPMMTAEELKDLGEDIKKNRLQQAVTILSKSNGEELLLDGPNRLDAMEHAGIKFNLSRRKNGRLKLEILEEDVPFIFIDYAHTVYDGGDFDPHAYVVSANIHRRHLSAEQRRDLIAKVLKANPEKSNRQIAEAVKVDHKTVASVRAKEEARGEIPHVSTVEDSKGRQQPAHKPPTPPATPQKATTDSALVQSTPDQPPPAELIAAVHDKIIAKCVVDVTTHIAEAVDHLDDIGCVTLLERLQAIINMLLVTANKRAVESIFGEEPPKAAERATKPETKQLDDLAIPEFLRR